MESATAIGVAAGAIAFLDFIITLCKLASQVSSSVNGAMKYNSELEVKIKEFEEMTEEATSPNSTKYLRCKVT
jgi:hypothetical protein